MVEGVEEGCAGGVRDLCHAPPTTGAAQTSLSAAILDGGDSLLPAPRADASGVHPIRCGPFKAWPPRPMESE